MPRVIAFHPALFSCWPEISRQRYYACKIIVALLPVSMMRRDAGLKDRLEPGIFDFSRCPAPTSM
jgi:hypothetical protein